MVKGIRVRRFAKVMPVLAAVLLSGCGSDRNEQVMEEQGVDLHMRVERLDSALFHTPLEDLGTSTPMFKSRFGKFYRIYVEYILQGPPLEDPRLPLVLTKFVTDPDWSLAQRGIDSVFRDMSPYDQGFEQAFERLKAFFPDSLVPRVIAFNAGYLYGVLPTDSVLGVGLEWFIGPDHPIVGRLAPENFPQFVKDRMRAQMLVPGATKGWLQVHYTRDTRGEDLLTNMVEIGRVMYLLHALLPDAPRADLFAYEPGQLEWCEQHELDIWTQVISEELLYSKRLEDVNRLLNDGPFTNGFPRETPGHMGEWIGYRMVKGYMDANPDLTMAQLFQNRDARAILKSYKPR